MDLTTPVHTHDELHQWIRTHTGLSVPRASVCPHHHAPFEYLKTAYFEPAQDQIVWAPRGGGKTSLAAVATLLDLLHKPGVGVRILGGSLDQSLRMWEYLLSNIHDERIGAGILADPKAVARKLRLTNGSSAAVLTQSQRSVRGVRVQKVRCDEVELFDRAIWSAAQLTTRSVTLDGKLVKGSIEALSTMHKPYGLMRELVDKSAQSGTRVVRWCLLEVLERCTPDRDCQTCPLYSDCRGIAKERCDGFFPIEDAIRMKGRVSDTVWQSEMLCRRPSVEGMVFPMLDPKTHYREDWPFPRDAQCDWWLGIDFGFNAPLVCLWIVRRGELVYVVDEHIEAQKTLPDHLELIRARDWPKVPRVACDPAGASRNEQTAKSNVHLLMEAGYQVKTRGSHIVDGIETIRAALRSASGETRLFIHPRCVRLIRSLEGYHYQPGTSELPHKDGTHDHAVDALRYFFVNAQKLPLTTRRY
jgi:hypothetical protein